MSKFTFAHLIGLGKAPSPAASASAGNPANAAASEAAGDETENEDEDGEDTDEEAAVQQRVAAAVTAERERCASIFALPAAANNIAQAAELAFNTDLSVDQASKVLGTAPKAGKDRLATVMHGRSPNLGTDRAAETHADAQTVAANWGRAIEQANSLLPKTK